MRTVSSRHLVAARARVAGAAPAAGQEAALHLVKTGTFAEDLYLAGERIEFRGEAAGDLAAAAPGTSPSKASSAATWRPPRPRCSWRAACWTTSAWPGSSWSSPARWATGSSPPARWCGSPSPPGWAAPPGYSAGGWTCRGGCGASCGWPRCACASAAPWRATSISPPGTSRSCPPPASREASPTGAARRRASRRRPAIAGRVIQRQPEFFDRAGRMLTVLGLVTRALVVVNLFVTGVVLFLLFPRFTVAAARTVGASAVGEPRPRHRRPRAHAAGGGVPCPHRDRHPARAGPGRAV